MKNYYFSNSNFNKGILIILLGFFITSCSKKTDPKPQPTTFDSKTLLGGRWTTVGATVKKPDGTTEQLDQQQVGGLYLSDVQFATGGSANESDYGNLTWSYDQTSNVLVVTFDPGDGSVTAHIVTLTANKLVLQVVPPIYGVFSGASEIDQTLTR